AKRRAFLWTGEEHCHGSSCLVAWDDVCQPRELGGLGVRCENHQFDTILNEPSVIIIQMRVNTCLPESVPRVIPHLETQTTDKSFIQNNIKSGSPGMC